MQNNQVTSVKILFLKTADSLSGQSVSAQVLMVLSLTPFAVIPCGPPRHKAWTAHMMVIQLNPADTLL